MPFTQATGRQHVSTDFAQTLCTVLMLPFFNCSKSVHMQTKTKINKKKNKHILSRAKQKKKTIPQQQTAKSTYTSSQHFPFGVRAGRCRLARPSHGPYPRQMLADRKSGKNGRRPPDAEDCVSSNVVHQNLPCVCLLKPLLDCSCVFPLPLKKKLTSKA